MYHLCPACNTWITQNPSEYNEFTSTMRKKRDQHLYENNIINIINLDKVDKILDDYVTTHNKIFYYYLVGCDIKLEFDNNSTSILDIGYCNNVNDITQIENYLLYKNNLYKSRG